MSKPEIIAIIPARGGSKSVPRKNIKELGGKPLIGYMIDAARKSAYITALVVSSEDDEILKVSGELGGDDVILVKRPVEFAEDKSPSLPVIEHAVNEVETKTGKQFDAVVMLQCTTPFVTAEDIDACLEKLITTDADSVMSVNEVSDYHPAKLKRITDNDQLVQYVEGLEEKGFTRQQFVPVYKRNGAVYASMRDIVMEKGKLYGGDDIVTRAHIMPGERSVDINSPLDFFVAEQLLKYREGPES